MPDVLTLFAVFNAGFAEDQISHLRPVGDSYQLGASSALSLLTDEIGKCFRQLRWPICFAHGCCACMPNSSQKKSCQAPGRSFQGFKLNDGAIGGLPGSITRQGVVIRRGGAAVALAVLFCAWSDPLGGWSVQHHFWARGR